MPACTSCHDFKDRDPIYNWPIESIAEVIKGCSTPQARIFLAKTYALLLDSRAGPPPDPPPEPQVQLPC